MHTIPSAKLIFELNSRSFAFQKARRDDDDVVGQDIDFVEKMRRQHHSPPTTLGENNIPDDTS
jgi:hypothetical protein